MSDRLAKLEKLLALDPADTFVLYGIAQEHGKAGDFAKAIEFYDRTLAADPAYCYAYFHKARAQQAAGDLTGAHRPPSPACKLRTAPAIKKPSVN
ncbi:MAG: hypothetical protein QM783_15600 [Phycisphaerales bacterium]